MSNATAERPSVPKKKDKPEPSKQVAFRLALTMVDRLDEAAKQLGLDTSNLLRMMIIEKLPEYEDRGRRAHGDLSETAD